MALGSAQPLTEMSTRNLPGSKGRPARLADNLTAICEPRCLKTVWAFMACYGIALPLHFIRRVNRTSLLRVSEFPGRLEDRLLYLNIVFILPSTPIKVLV
jgi:hypothetical protein